MNQMPSPPTISIQNHGPVQNQVGNQYVNGDIIINSGNETQEYMISLCRDVNAPHNDRSKLIREKGKRTKGTCEWIKSNTAYRSWEQNRKSQVLWISGGPGKGKTMLSIYLTEELNPRQSDSHLLAYFFCSNQDESRNTIMGILRGLLWQILRDRDALIDHLLSEYKMKKEALFHDPSSSDSLWRIFKSIVCDSRLGTVFCIIDGLDECNEFSIKFFLMELREWFEVELRDSPRTTFKLAVISRDLPNWLKNKLSDFPHINLDPDHKSQVGSDIEKFIANKVDELSVDLECSPELKEKIRQAFVQGSQGTFLWVGLVAKDLSEMDVSEVEAALDLLPKHLPGIYARMLREIQQNRREIASSVLRWVVTALRPLTLTELATAMNVQETNAISREQKIRGYVRFCGSILKVTDNEVGLVHQSAKDYLQRQQPDEDDVLEWFRIKRDEANLTLMRYCFEYIHQPLESGPVNLKLDHSIYSRDFPMLNYAVVSWPEHARFSPECGGHLRYLWSILP